MGIYGNEQVSISRNWYVDMVLCSHATKKLNCWNTIKLLVLQRKDETSLNVICGENRKNLVDGTRLNPNSYFKNW